MRDSEIIYGGAYLKLFKGFTLAEVLITLGIIGVVAALTMPALVANYKKQEAVSKLKKSYTMLAQALKMSELDNGEFQYWDKGRDANAYLERFWLPYFKSIKVCKTYQECGYESNKPWYMLSGRLNDWKVVDSGKRIPFMTSDGFLYNMSMDTDDARIFIDINGAKPPNMTGKDLFIFVITDKGIFPREYDQPEDVINTNCKRRNSNGYSCAAKIMRDGWEMKSDYPW